MTATYFDRARQRLEALLLDQDPALLELYTLLVLTRGENVMCADVHDAWSAWRLRSDPQHACLVPFAELNETTQARDQKYATAIARAARELRDAQEASG